MSKLFEYKIDGPALCDGVPIHIVISALENFQSVLDKTYLVMVGSKRMTAYDRERFILRASNFSRGSFLTQFEIVLSSIQLSLPFIGSLGPQNVWDYTKDTFNFLKIVCSSVQEGNKPQYKFNNSVDVEVITGDIHNHYHGQVIQIAKLAHPSYQSLASLIEPNKLNYISAGVSKQEKPDIYIGNNDRGIFDIPTRMEKETVKLRCEIFDFNKFKNTGKISITLKDQAVDVGEYNFSTFGSQDNVDYIHSMLKLEVNLFCLIEIESNPFGEDKVHKLHITGIDTSNRKKKG